MGSAGGGRVAVSCETKDASAGERGESSGGGSRTWSELWHRGQIQGAWARVATVPHCQHAAGHGLPGVGLGAWGWVSVSGRRANWDAA